MRFTEILEDLTRRGFIRGVGAAAATAGTNVLAKTANHTLHHKLDTHSTKVQPLVNVKKVDADTARQILSAHAVKSGMVEPVELAQFLAQCSAETGNFAHLGEIGRPAKLAHKYSHSTGNHGKFDALEYAGRGYIQLTGKGNYLEAGKDLYGDANKFVDNPDLAADPQVAAKIATWFWNKNVKPRVHNFADTAAVTKAINGRGAPQHEIQKRHQLFSAYYPAVKQWASRRA
jgi:predicted chitinase